MQRLARLFISAAVFTACLCSSIFCALAPALANGYDVYASPLAWSPDGRYLAVAVGEAWPRGDVSEPGKLLLYTRDGRFAELASGSVGSPSFSPDGEKLSVVLDGRYVDYFLPRKDEPDLAGMASQTIGGTPDILDLRWNMRPDDEQELYWTRGERFYGCAVYAGILATSASPLSSPPPDSSVFAPVAAPDGSTLLCLMQGGLKGDPAYERVVRYNPADGSFTQLTKPQAREWDYHESNVVFVDEDTILFQRGGWGDWRLYRFELAEDKEYLEVADAQQPTLSTDARWLAFTRRDPQLKAQAEYDWEVPPTVWLRDRERGAEWQVSAPGVEAEYPALSPDGSKLAWLQKGDDGTPEVMLRSRAALLLH